MKKRKAATEHNCDLKNLQLENSEEFHANTANEILIIYMYIQNLKSQKKEIKWTKVENK